MGKQVSLNINSFFNYIYVVLLIVSPILLISGYLGNKSNTTSTKDQQIVYKSVNIGGQEWMAENLNVDYYRNGDKIPQVENPNEWSSLTSGAWCYFGNNTENGNLFGRLYNWYAVNDPRGLAPKGWLIPSEEDWKKLENFAGGETKVLPPDGVIVDRPTIVDGGASKLIANRFWDKYEGIKTTDKYGFSAYPGGARTDKGEFTTPLKVCLFWSSSEKSVKLQWFKSKNTYFMDMVKYTHKKNDGLSVRCLKY